jgi:2-methylcitrate dehydratase PrpD
MTQASISERIARYAIQTRFDDRDAASTSDVFSILELSIMDWLAVGRAGVDEPVSQVVRSLNLCDAGQAQSSIFGSPTRLPARLAAQVNGTTTHALDYDDTHFLHVGHTSVVVLSAVFAIAEARSASMREAIEAALIGSETCCHVGNWLGRSHYQAGFHQTATAGVFGATASACRLLKLDVDTTLHAIGLASTMASGLTSQFGTMGKPFHAGMAAAKGVEAALLAAGGFLSRTDALECEQGFAVSHHVDLAAAADRPFELGERGVFVDVQHKYHACCHGLHASLEALAHVRSVHSIDPVEVKHIDIRTNPRWLNVCNIQNPESGLESKFSFAHVTALLFHDHDTAALSTYSDSLCKDAALQAFRDRVSVIADDTLSDTQAHVSVEMKGRPPVDSSYDLVNPLPILARQEKLLSKCRSLIGALSTDALWSMIQQSRQMTAAEFTAATM